MFGFFGRLLTSGNLRPPDGPREEKGDGSDGLIYVKDEDALLRDVQTQQNNAVVLAALADLF